MTTPQDVSKALTDVSSKVFHFGWNNGYTSQVDKVSERFFEWNGRETKILNTVDGHRDKAAEGLRDPASHAALVRASAKTAGWTVAEAGSAIGTGITRGLGYLAGGVTWFLARVPLGLAATAVAAVPLAFAGGAELVHAGELGVKASGRWLKARAEQWKAISARAKAQRAERAAATVAEPATEGPALATTVEPAAAEAPATGEVTASATKPVAAPATEIATPTSPADLGKAVAPAPAAPAAPERSL